MKSFETIDSLIKELESDNANRFPARFIFFANFEEYRNFYKKITSSNYNILNISSLLKKDDMLISKDELVSAIKSQKESTLVFPFSELIRFYNSQDFQAIITQIIEIENNNDSINRRFLLPMIGIKERFNKDFFGTYTRSTDGSIKIWELEGVDREPIRLLIPPKGIDLPALNNTDRINTLKEWFDYWKITSSQRNILLYSKPLSLYSKNLKPDNIFNIAPCNNCKDLIFALYGLNIDWEYKDSDKKEWEELISKVNNEDFKLNKFIKDECVIYDFRSTEVLMKYITSDSLFQRWLLANLIIHNSLFNDSYIQFVFKKVENKKSKDDIIKGILLDIFDEDNISNGKFISERRDLLHSIKEKAKIYADLLSQRLENCASTHLAKTLCTNLFDSEKVFLLNKYKEGSIANITEIEDLTYYQDATNSYKIENIDADKEWMLDYFDNYKQSKIKDVFSPRISDYIKEKNKTENEFYNWYYGFKSVKDYLDTIKADEIIWVDALGMEWQPLLQHYLLESEDFTVDEVFVAKSNLPTTTKYNTHSASLKIDDLDNLAHNSGHYNYPKILIDEIKCINNIASKILSFCKKGKKTVIISDHGLSYLSRLSDSLKHNVKTLHDGRYVEGSDSLTLEDSNYIRHNNFIIASTHSSLDKKPTREVHGGCTPEEVLVPVFVISDRKTAKKTLVEIEELQRDFEQEERLFKFRTRGTNLSPKVYLNSELLQVEFDKKESVWVAEMPKAMSSTATIQILLSNKEKNVPITINSGFAEEELF